METQKYSGFAPGISSREKLRFQQPETMVQKLFNGFLLFAIDFFILLGLILIAYFVRDIIYPSFSYAMNNNEIVQVVANLLQTLFI